MTECKCAYCGHEIDIEVCPEMVFTPQKLVNFWWYDKKIICQEFSVECKECGKHTIVTIRSHVADIKTCSFEDWAGVKE